MLARGAWTPLARFGADGEWQVTAADATGFSVLHHGQTEGRVEWALLGEHNRLNALAAIIAARHVGVPVAHAISALSRFQNVRRRMEVRGVVAEVAVYDDFAHHPTAIATTLAGLRQRVGSARIIAVIEPRSNTMKLGVMKQALAESLMNADEVYCYSGGIDWDVAAALQPLGTRVTVIATVCSAHIETVLGDARLSLEREQIASYDIIVIDAFSSDSIPTHLMTQQAMAVYLKNLKPDGVIAFHTTNRFINLPPVIKRIADYFNLSTSLISDSPSEESPLSNTDWVLVTRSQVLLQQSLLSESASEIDKIPHLPIWTDSFNNLFRVLKN